MQGASVTIAEAATTTKTTGSVAKRQWWKTNYQVNKYRQTIEGKVMFFFRAKI